MAWLERTASAVFGAIYDHHGDLTVDPPSLAQALLDMPTADRIALARELLARTGRVVARDVGPWPVAGHKQRATGWNACRAAMMGDE